MSDVPVAGMSAGLRDRRRNGRFFEHHGQCVFFKEEGHAAAVLLLHGYPTGSYDWHALWPLLSPHFRLIAPDMLGLGFSDKPHSYRYSIAHHAEMHDALLDALGVSEVHLLAHDLGVSVAQEMLARRVQGSTLPRIASLTLLNGGVCPEAYRPRFVQRLLASPIGAWLGPRLPRAAVDRALRELFAGHSRPSDSLLDDFWVLINHNDGRRVAHAVGRFWRDRLLTRDRLVEPLLQGRAPLRLINGAADPNSGRHMVTRFRELVPQVDVVSLEHVGHWPQIEAPEAVARSFMDFVNAPIDPLPLP